MTTLRNLISTAVISVIATAVKAVQNNGAIGYFPPCPGCYGPRSNGTTTEGDASPIAVGVALVSVLLPIAGIIACVCYRRKCGRPDSGGDQAVALPEAQLALLVAQPQPIASAISYAAVPNEAPNNV